MDKNDVVKMPLRADSTVIYFGTGGKRYLLRIAPFASQPEVRG